MDTDHHAVIESRAGGRFRKDNIKPLVGDYVILEGMSEQSMPLIIRIEPRKNALIRPPVANIDMLLIVLSPRKPKSDPLLCDKLLLQARQIGIEPMIAVNKTDRFEQEAHALADEFSGACRVVLISAQTGLGTDELRSALRGRTTCLTGQSAVGKSTLLNLLTGDERQRTGGLSRKVDRGKHTTRTVELFPIPELDAYLIDTPGFSILEIPSGEEQDLASLYPEFVPFIGSCRFDSCRHNKEPDCAVKQALDEGKIAPGRYERYLKILEDREERR